MEQLEQCRKSSTDSQMLCVLGMSTFSTKGGLYERAQKRFNVSDGKRLFTYSFYEKRKLEALVCANLDSARAVVHSLMFTCCIYETVDPLCSAAR